MDKAADIVAENLAQNLIDLSGWGFSPNRTAELGFYHRERGLYIRPLVVMTQKSVPVEVVVVPHSVPQTVITSCGASHSPSIALEGDISYATYCLDYVKITATGIGSICRYFIDGERLSSFGQQGNKLSRVAGFIGCCLDTGNDVSLDPAHQMGLNKCLLATIAVFMVIPSGISFGGKSRRIDSEIRLKPRNG